MNETGILLLWCAVQATLYLLVGAVVYLVVRRFGPATGAWAAACTLIMLCTMTTAMFSPWPRWWSPTANEKSPAIEETAALSTANAEAAGASATSTGDAAARPKPAGVSLPEYWRILQQELKAAGTASSPIATPRRWPTVVAVTLVAGAVLALARMLVGLAALARYGRRLSVIDDPALHRLADTLAESLGCRRPIELRQSLSLATPATMGWRRPVIVLPGDWQSWSEVERRVVLAHEIAHIARGDYLTWLLAQLAVALHVYHPLAHWLAGRLRLEQELAADASAAEAAGGRENYLFTLAQMALRQDDRRVAWAARPFLPTRGTLLRRIEMLSETKRLTNRPVSRRRGAALAGVAGLAALAISGFRAPIGGETAAQAAPPAQTTTAPASAAKAIDLSYVPSSAVAVFAVRPSELLAKEEMQPLVKLLNETIEKRTGLKVEKVEELKIAITRVPSPETRGPDGAMLQVIRYAEPFDWKGKFAEDLVGKPVEAKVAGKTYYHSDHGEQAIRRAFYLPDDRTIVFGPEIDLQRAILSAGRSKPEWAADWEKSSKGIAAAMVDVAAIGRVLNEELKRSPQQQPMTAIFSPLWEKGQRLFVSAQASDGLSISARMQCAGDDDAQRVRDTVQAALTLARNALDDADRQAAQATAAQAAAIVPLIDLAREVLKQGKLTIDGHEVQYASAHDLDAAETAVSVIAPAIVAAREAARKVQTANNLKQIMLAFHNYADVHGHFPAPVVIGPDGKTPHSWRIEILPYIEQQALYMQYKMDEPWDSENNKKVLAQMPVPLHNPEADPSKFETCYFALVGPATALGPKDGKGTKILEITDGTSNTIAVVEAKRPVPWTKPEDIDYDPTKPLPRFGGWHTGGFWAAFCDGSVRFVTDSTDQQKLHAYITKAGGELITNP